MKISTGISLVSLFKALSGGSSLPAPKIAFAYLTFPLIDPVNDPYTRYVELAPRGQNPVGNQLGSALSIADSGSAYRTIDDPDGIIEVYNPYTQQVVTSGQIRLKNPGLYNVIQYANPQKSQAPSILHMMISTWEDSGYVDIPWIFASEQNVSNQSPVSEFYSYQMNSATFYVNQAEIDKKVLIEEWVESINDQEGDPAVRLYEYSIRIEYYPL